MRVPYGDWVAYEPALIVGLCALFVLMCGVSPVAAPTQSRRGRGAVARHRRRAVPAPLSRPPASRPPGPGCCTCCSGAPARPSARGASHRRRRHCSLRSLPGSIRRDGFGGYARCWSSLALVYFMVGVSSPDAVDVIYAVMEGATLLIHGVLPYGHMPQGIIHGDTYPILSYAAVHAAGAGVTRSLPVGLGRRRARGRGPGRARRRLGSRSGPQRVPRRVSGVRRPVEVEEAGLRAALAWLAFPSVLITVSTGTTDIVLAAMLAIAVLLWRRPTLCTGILAGAGWFKLAPFALVPVSLAPLRGRRLAWALAAIALVSLPMVALLLALGGLNGPAGDDPRRLLPVHARLRAVVVERARDRRRSSRSQRGASSA